MRTPRLLPALVILVASIGCATPAPPPPRPPAPPPAAAPTREARFAAALAAIAAHDAADSFTPAICDQLVKELLDAGSARPAIARYNAGLAASRCDRRERAIALFKAAVEADPALSPARIALALAEAAEARDGGDLAGAERRLGKALVADEGSAEILAELALVHVAIAHPTRDAARLEIARGVAARAIERAPDLARAHFALGSVMRALGDQRAAVASFDRARARDPRLFEAHTSAAELRLRFRDLAGAETTYRDALRLRPGDYEAHVGLARTLHARLDEGDTAGWADRVDAATQAFDAAIALAPDRPDAFFHAGKLAAQQGSQKDPRSLFRATHLFRTFLARSEGIAALEEQRQEAREWLDAILGSHEPRMTERERKARDAARKQKEAEDEARAP